MPNVAAIPEPLVAPQMVGPSGSDRKALTLLIVTCLLAYIWFFQGVGYNQNSHFDTVRAIVEHGTLEITRYAQNTGDVSMIDGRIYSNKPPGLAIVGTPLYAVIYWIERAAGLDPDAPTIWRLNLYLLTLWTTAFPGVFTVAALYFWFRREGADIKQSLLWSGAFAFGTLVWPYAGVMMVHNFVAMCLFVAWMLITLPRSSLPRTGLAGVLLGFGVLAEYLVAPMIVLFAIEHVRRRRFLPLPPGEGRGEGDFTSSAGLRSPSPQPSPEGRGGKSWAQGVIVFLVGPAIALLALLAIHTTHFGGATSTTYSHQEQFFRQDHLFLGVFHWPDLRRVYWLTLHPLRGLFYNCPAFFIFLFALLRPGTARLLKDRWLPLTICAYFLLFNLTFHGWTGGFAIGPRYLIPALPFLFLFVKEGWQVLPRVSLALMTISIFNMFAVTAVRVMFPANSFGPPINENPVAECVKRLTMNQLARNEGSFNLGLLIGLPGTISLLPVLVMLLLFFGMVTEKPCHPRRRWL